MPEAMTVRRQKAGIAKEHGVWERQRRHEELEGVELG